MSASEITGEKQGRWPKGISGNPAGRPRGARGRAALAAEVLLDGQVEALTQMAVNLALAGDTTALRLCLERIMPPRRDVTVKIDLPRMNTSADIVKTQSAIMMAVAEGELTPSEGNAVSAIVELTRKAIEIEEIERRLARLEQAQGK